MLPLSLLRASTGLPLLVELKDGTTYNGRLGTTDPWMNMNLHSVICTSATGERFWKMESCYIRGSAIKYLRLSEACLEKAVQQEEEQQQQREKSRPAFRAGGGGGGRGGRFDQRGGGRGRGRGGRGGGGRGRGRGRSPQPQHDKSTAA